MDASTLRARARPWPKGHTFEDFTVGDRFEHHWGRTLTESDTVTFSALTLSYNPAHFNAEYARGQGHQGLVVNPMLVFLTVFGLSVQDLSEAGGAFLGVNALTFHRPVAVGETLTAASTVTAIRESKSRPTQGIVTWHTEGRSGAELIIDFERTNLIRKRDAEERP
ncbi:MAG: MaoC family dehydratase [Streptosporangiales bacterium]|nr:MaoC family dehydratase [Streptosporangiales bacterium]